MSCGSHNDCVGGTTVSDMSMAFEAKVGFQITRECFNSIVAAQFALDGGREDATCVAEDLGTCPSSVRK